MIEFGGSGDPAALRPASGDPARRVEREPEDPDVALLRGRQRPAPGPVPDGHVEREAEQQGLEERDPDDGLQEAPADEVGLLRMVPFF